MKRPLSNILVTGGAGFIGTNFIQSLFRNPEFSGRIVNFDLLTYAGNLENLAGVQREFGGSRYEFVSGDIRDRKSVQEVFERFDIDTVIHFAAESHVDRSIEGPEAFMTTNVMGTFTLLDVARKAWSDRSGALFHHVSTDEVFGSLGADGRFTESTPYDPRSPYSASKAGSDHLVRAYYHTFGFPATISNCSNNYGPYQFPEKLIPLMILNMLEEKPLPVYGDGRNIRDWLFVGDHASAIWRIITKADPGSTWNVGGDNEWENLRLVNVLCEKVATARGLAKDHYKKLISFVRDRPGHDRRYSIDCGRIRRELEWSQSVHFDKGLDLTVAWYLENPEWIKNIRTGNYRDWLDRNYGRRSKVSG